MSSLYSILGSLAVLLCVLKYSDAVRCFVCNSQFEPSCVDPFYPVNIPLMDCDAKVTSQFTRSSMCKKVTKKMQDSTYHVIRDCSPQDFNMADGYSCVTTPNGDYNCRCYGDACNSASALGRRLWMPFMIIALLVSRYNAN